jgi:hypothetical protein
MSHIENIFVVFFSHKNRAITHFMLIVIYSQQTLHYDSSLRWIEKQIGNMYNQIIMRLCYHSHV